MSDELKPCPFCGNSAQLIDDRTAWLVECTGCKAVAVGRRVPEQIVEHTTGTDWKRGRQSAIKRWNTRIEARND